MKIKKDRLHPLLHLESVVRRLSPENRTGVIASAEIQMMKQPAYPISQEDMPAVEVIRRVLQLGGEKCIRLGKMIYCGIRGANVYAQQGLSAFPVRVKTFRDLSFGYEMMARKRALATYRNRNGSDDNGCRNLCEIQA